MAGEVNTNLIPDVFKLSNGLEVWYIERSVLPFVVFKFVIPAGSLFDPEGKKGLANVVSQMLFEGSKNYSSKDIAEKLDFMGVDYSVSVSRDYATIYFRTLTDYLDDTLKIVADVIQNPTFPQEEFNRVKKEIISDIIKSEEDPGYVASKTFSSKVYGKNHPYGYPVYGNVDSVEAISRDDVINFYREHYKPIGSRLIVVGNISKDNLIKILEKYFSGWNGVSEGIPPEPEIRSESGTFTVLKNTAQATVIIGHPCVRRSNPDFIKLVVANQVFGGSGLTSRLFERIREKGGYAYSVYSYVDPTYYTGSFKIVFQTENSRVKSAITEVIEELRRFVKGGVTSEELSMAKSYLIGSFPLKLDTNGKIADYLAFVSFYNLAKDYLVRYPKEIESVTIEDVREVVKKYISSDKITTVIVGNVEVK
ncbi:MAG: M16 family metallopeptidase [Thermosulfidibacteraceae bacterium]